MDERQVLTLLGRDGRIADGRAVGADVAGQGG